jgi:hypothetical protein
VLIIFESSLGAFLLITLYLIYRIITFVYHLFSALAKSNHKCIQPCYFPLLFKTGAQKVKMCWNSSKRSSRLRVAPVAVPVVFWSFLLFCFHLKVILVFRDIIYAIIILYS